MHSASVMTAYGNIALYACDVYSAPLALFASVTLYLCVV